jgi:hypothetical protein
LERAQRSTQQLAEATGCCQHRDTVSALKELVRLAECGCDVLTIENVKEVLRIPARVHVVR